MRGLLENLVPLVTKQAAERAACEVLRKLACKLPHLGCGIMHLGRAVR